MSPRSFYWNLHKAWLPAGTWLTQKVSRPKDPQDTFFAHGSVHISKHLQSYLWQGTVSKCQFFRSPELSKGLVPLSWSAKSCPSVSQKRSHAEKRAELADSRLLNGWPWRRLWYSACKQKPHGTGSEGKIVECHNLTPHRHYSTFWRTQSSWIACSCVI